MSPEWLVIGLQTIKERTMKRSGFLALALAGIFCLATLNASAQLINELDINPGGTDQPCEYVELRGTPGAVIQNVHFVAFEGDSGAAIGTADFVVTFGSPGPAFGTNGLIVITGTAACGSRTYAPETNRIQTTLLDAANGLENTAISFLLISSATAITPNTDYDTNNDGTLEGLPAGATILDAVAWSGGAAGDVNYGGVVLSATGGTIGAATRFPSNTTPNSAAAWYAGQMIGTNDANTYHATIRTANFPVNGALTPGAPNVGTAPRDSPVDIDGDGLTDYVVVRPAGGAGSQLTWHNHLNATGPFSTREWGISGDQVIAGDYDGDGKDDEAVFRPSNATFYIIQSATLTGRIEQFGQTGDNGRVVGDYDGDGRDDLALYRSGTPSQWFYKTSSSALFTSVEWGQNGDFPAPGDYDGDGRNDFVVQRASGGNGVFFKRLSGGTFANEQFGLSSDGVVPGDYDGDGKTDIAVFRTNAGLFVWDFEPSGTAGTTVVSDTWGVPGDLTVQGDYDGDGKTDYAVWRAGTFFVMTVGDRRIWSRPFGQAGDTPVARYNTF